MSNNVQALIQAFRRTLRSEGRGKVDFCMWCKWILSIFENIGMKTWPDLLIANFLAFDVIGK
jgi:hypothetical protein